MMAQYLETMTALQGVDQGALSDAEAMYYAEVMLRINQKLLGIILKRKTDPYSLRKQKNSRRELKFPPGAFLLGFKPRLDHSALASS